MIDTEEGKTRYCLKCACEQSVGCEECFDAVHTCEKAPRTNIPEYNFAQLNLLIHALEMLDVSLYDGGYIETHKHLLERFREMIKEAN